MVMMRHAGLVGARFTPNAKNSQRIGVVAMVAAMIHDYREPPPLFLRKPPPFPNTASRLHSQFTLNMELSSVYGC